MLHGQEGSGLDPSGVSVIDSCRARCAATSAAALHFSLSQSTFIKNVLIGKTHLKTARSQVPHDGRMFIESHEGHETRSFPNGNLYVPSGSGAAARSALPRGYIFYR